MPFTKESQAVGIHFSDKSASFMKKLLAEKEASLRKDLSKLEDPEKIVEVSEQIAICKNLTQDLKSTVLIVFGPQIWDQL